MFSTSYLGKMKRLGRLFQNERTLLVPIDDSLIFGPFLGLENMSSTLHKVVNARPNAILGYKGSASILQGIEGGLSVPFIFNVTASTVEGQHIKKVVTGTVLEAISMGADCVAVHVNYSNEYENEMIRNLAVTVTEADKYGVPVLAIAYPRRLVDGKTDNYEAEKTENIEAYVKRVCRCVRTSVEMGADIVKTQYTGSVESFRKVIASAMGKPVVIAGGPQVDVEVSYTAAREAIDAGAAGVSFGRNVFNASNITAYLSGMKEIVFNDLSVKQALEKYKEVQLNV